MSFRAHCPYYSLVKGGGFVSLTETAGESPEDSFLSCLFSEQIQFTYRSFLSRTDMFWKLTLAPKNLKPGWWKKYWNFAGKEKITSGRLGNRHDLVFASSLGILLAFLLGKSHPSGEWCRGNFGVVSMQRLLTAESEWPILRDGLDNKLLLLRDSCVFPKLKVKSSINAKCYCNPDCSRIGSLVWMIR